MAQPTAIVWERDPHTEAKHDILRRYLQAWYPIMLQAGFPGVTYAEGFAGPGEYSKGEPGSPVIALEESLDRAGVVGIGKPLRFALVEERKDRLDHLRQLIRNRWPQAQRPANVQIQGKSGLCENEFLPLLTRLKAFGDPIFANLDAWGADIPYSVVARIGANRSSEVSVTLTTEYFQRFAADPNVPGDDVFGDASWRAVTNEPSHAKLSFLVECYRATLRRAGFQFVLVFELIDSGGHVIHIFHGSQNEKALQKMKEAMWAVDPIRGMRFRDPRDPNQLAFDMNAEQPDLRPLNEMILRHLQEHGAQTVAELRRFTLLDTMFREPHATKVVRQLTKDGRLNRQPSSGNVTRATTVQIAP